MKRTPMRFGLIGLVIGMLAACSAGGGLPSDPARAVEQYLLAKAAADKTTLRGLLCKEMEAALEREAQSFGGVKAHTEGLACKADAGAGGLVHCSGKIVAEYGGEAREFSLGSYRAVLEDGRWKWCGESVP